MFERWLEEQTRVQEEDQKGVSPQLNNQSQGEQVQSDVLQQTTKLQQPSLSTAVRYLIS